MASRSPRLDAPSLCLLLEVPIRNTISGSQMSAVPGSFLHSGLGGLEKRYDESLVAYHVRQ
jgi:hypothetical protein